MKSLMEKVSYVCGLAEGLKIDQASNEGKVLGQIMKILEQVATEISDIKETQDRIITQMGEVEDRLGDLELDFDFSDDDMEDLFNSDKDDDSDEGCFEIECPGCNKTVIISESALGQDDIVCPNCKERIEIEFDCDGCEGSCCHDHDEDFDDE